MNARLRATSPGTLIACVALIVAAIDVTPADAVRAAKRALFADNAGSVNGIKASRTPKAGLLVPLGTDGKFDASVLPSTATRGPRGAEGPAGPVGATGPQGARGPSSARVVRPAPVTLSRNVGVTVPVATIAGVEPGSYIAMFTGEADYRSANVRMYIVCELRLNGAVIAGTKGIVGETAGSTGSLNLALVHPITRSASFDLSVTCFPDQPSVSGQAAGSLQSQTLALIKLDSVTVG